MKRREVIMLLSGAAAWPLAAGAQQPDRVRRIGVLNGLAETDAEVQTYDAAFRKRLDELGWIDGRNIHIDYRRGAGSVERMQLFAKELVQLNPEVIFTFTTPATAALQAETSTSRLFFRRPIRLAADSSPALQIQAATSLASLISRLPWAANGSSCCMRLLRAFRALRSCSTRKPHRLFVIIWQRSDPLRLRLPSSRSRPPFTVLPRSGLS